MKKKTLATLFLSLCLCAQLNLCSAEKPLEYDEEITLPIGTNFDLEMEEVTRYEYDGEYVKNMIVNNKEQFILQKAGDTIITVIMDDKGVKTELRVLVHIVSEQQFNSGTPAGTVANQAPASTAQQPAATSTTTSQTAPASNAQQPAAVKTTEPGAIGVPAATATTKPAATKHDTAKTAETKQAKASEPSKVSKAPKASDSSKTATTATNAKIAKDNAQAAPVQAPQEALITSQTISRPTAKPQNSVQAAKYKADQYAFDVLDLVNAERAKYKLRPLSMAKDLMGEAGLRARELPSRFSHTRPNGTKYYTVMSNPGMKNGENIAAGQTTPAQVVKAWMRSTVHREAILSPIYTELGVGYYETSSANYSCYWIQLFRG